MMKIVLSAFLLTNYCFSIIGGKEVLSKNAPYVVALTDLEGKVFCSGTLIQKNTVITAAHCLEFKSAQSIKVHIGVGSSSGYIKGKKNYKVKSSHIRECYFLNIERSKCDIGILKIEKKIESEVVFRFKKNQIVFRRKELGKVLSHGSKLIFYGFGHTEVGTWGRKRRAEGFITKFSRLLIQCLEDPLNSCESQELQILKAYVMLAFEHSEKPVVPNYSLYQLKYKLEQLSSEDLNVVRVFFEKNFPGSLIGIKDGDSGGPVFKETRSGKLKLLGVTISNMSNNSLYGSAGFLPIYDHWKWIERNI